VSGHLNHISLYHGVSLLLATPQADIIDPLTAYSLKSKPIVIEYIGILAPLYVRLKTALSRAVDAMGRGVKSSSSSSFDRPIFVAGIRQYLRSVEATKQHQSQLVWFRWLFMAFSQHMWVNEWEPIPVIQGGRVS
jgi:N-acetylglucosaminylphosphatidylinositol deacetylase